MRAVLSGTAAATSRLGLVPLLMFDDVELALDNSLLATIDWSERDQAKRTPMCCLFSGLRRPLLDNLPASKDFFEGLHLIKIDRLDDASIDSAIRRTASSLSVTISDSTAELIAQQLNGDLFQIKTILAAAADRGVALKTFIDFERLYVDELLSGRLARYYDAVLNEVASEPRARRAVFEVLEMLSDTEPPPPREAVLERAAEFATNADQLMANLHTRELLTLSLGFVQRSEDPVFLDYARAVYRREIRAFRPPVAGSELLGQNLKHSYRLMMSRYNTTVEAQLIEALSGFEFQSAPACLFDDAVFEEKFRAMSRVVVRRGLETDEVRVRLPQITDITDAGLGDHAGVNWRLFVAGGFEGGIYSDAAEVTWLIALINSKEPLDLETLGRIDNRLESSARSRARSGHGSRHVKWYISKEGFSAAASERLGKLRAHHSTYSQLDLLHDYVAKPRADETRQRPLSEFDLVIPIDSDSELIAARTAEQIARAAEFDQESINQIKTALVEACLNAAEHSDSPDRRIYQHFALDEDRLVIRVSNKGGAFTVMDNGTAVGSKNRGRGLQIIRALMDEVTFERTDEGASLVMVKLLKRPKALSKPQAAK
jgi:serine/threonine-protein kinase RsbW